MTSCSLLIGLSLHLTSCHHMLRHVVLVGYDVSRHVTSRLAMLRHAMQRLCPSSPYVTSGCIMATHLPRLM